MPELVDVTQLALFQLPTALRDNPIPKAPPKPTPFEKVRFCDECGAQLPSLLKASICPGCVPPSRLAVDRYDGRVRICQGQCCEEGACRAIPF